MGSVLVHWIFILEELLTVTATGLDWRDQSFTVTEIESHTHLVTGARTLLDGHIMESTAQTTPSTINNQKMIIIILHLMLETVEVAFNFGYNCRVFLAA